MRKLHPPNYMETKGICIYIYMHTIGEIPLFLLTPIQSFLATQKIYTAFCLLTQKISQAYTLQPGFFLHVPCIHVSPMVPNLSQPLPIEEGGAAISGQSALRPQAWGQDGLWDVNPPKVHPGWGKMGMLSIIIHVIYEYDIFHIVEYMMEEWEDITYGKISYDLQMTMEYIYI